MYLYLECALLSEQEVSGKSLWLLSEFKHKLFRQSKHVP